MDIFLTLKECGEERSVSVTPDDTGSVLQGKAHAALPLPADAEPEDIILAVDGTVIDGDAALRESPGLCEGCHVDVSLSGDRFVPFLKDGTMWLDSIPAWARLSPACLLAAATRDSRALSEAPDTLLNNEEFMLQAVARHASSLRFASEALRSNPEFLVRCAKLNSVALGSVPPELRSRDLVLSAVRFRGSLLKHAPPALQGDREIVLEAVAQQGGALAYAGELRGDEEVALAALRQDSAAMAHVADSLREDKEFMIRAASASGAILQYAGGFRNDPDVALAAVSETPLAMAFIRNNLREDTEFLLRVVQCNMDGLSHVRNLKPDFLLEAARINRGALRFAGTLLRDMEFAMRAVAEDGLALKELHKDMKGHRNVVRAAVRNNPAALQYADPLLQSDPEFASVVAS